MRHIPDINRFRTGEGGFIGPEELHDLLLDEGYSAGNRQQYLKSLLTSLPHADAEHEPHRAGRDALMREVEDVLSQEQETQGNDPMSDEV
ncbi:MAG: hypothetical protein RID23_19960 [Roseovarius sp.]